MQNTLDKILEYKRDEVASQKRRVPLADVKKKAHDAEPARDFLGNFQKGSINIIAEVKKASPSKGIIRQDFNALDTAHIYQDNGAKALSILTDEHFFMGSLNYLVQIKKQVSLPCLRKDFMIEEYQFHEARAHGADAVLLIVAALDDHQLKDFQQLARELGMSVLVEIHNQAEWKRAAKLPPHILGVNNRDLKNFKTSLQTSYDLVKEFPQSFKRITESGLNTHDDCVKLMEAGYDGFLIGESLMREKDIGKKLREMIG
ncbi:indole-3-glycerol phosphate synthase TrpC [bacterium]|nr:indole-3-glycerol phosphate synthase TrpC [bacterium]